MRSIRTFIPIAIGGVLGFVTACGSSTGVQASIGPSGGSLSMESPAVRFDVPAGALSTETMVSLHASADSQSLLVSLEPAQLTLAKPGQLSVSMAGTRHLSGVAEVTVVGEQPIGVDARVEDASGVSTRLSLDHLMQVRLLTADATDGGDCARRMSRRFVTGTTAARGTATAIITTGRTATAVTTMASTTTAGCRATVGPTAEWSVRRSVRPASSVTTASASPTAATTSTTTTAGARTAEGARTTTTTTVTTATAGIPDRARLENDHHPAGGLLASTRVARLRLAGGHRRRHLRAPRGAARPWVEGYVRDATARPLRYRFNGLRVFAVRGDLRGRLPRAAGSPGTCSTSTAGRWAGACVLGLVFTLAVVLPARGAGVQSLADLYLGRLENPQWLGGRVDAKMLLYLSAR